MNREKSKTFKSLIENRKRSLRIANQIFSDEILSTKNATRCIFIEIVVHNLRGGSHSNETA